MNKKQNKSVKKTKHRVQKTKRSQRLNKNRSIKGIRSNNNTKIVEKRRKIVQRGGGDINDLVSRIFGLDEITVESERNTAIDRILLDIEPRNFSELAIGQGQFQDEPPNGPTLLYAACRLENPSLDLVKGILDKMRIRSHTRTIGAAIKNLTGKPRSVTSMVKIIPNGSSNGSYPQHGAIQAVKINLKNIKLIGMEHCRLRLRSIIAILWALKRYDEEEREFPKKPPSAGAQSDTPLMERKNHLPKSNGTYTAYQEFNGWFNSEPNIAGRLERLYDRNIVIDFEDALGHHDYSSLVPLHTDNPHSPNYIPPPPDTSRPLPPGWLEKNDDVANYPYYVNLTNGEAQWERPVAAPAPAAPFPYTHLSNILPGAGVQGLLPSTAPFTPDQQWERRFDRELNKPFWYNPDTKKLTWNDPAAAAPVPASAAPVHASAAPAPFFYTPLSTMLPGAGVQGLLHDGREHHVPPPGLENAFKGRRYVPPPDQWLILLDDDGRGYYYNPKTGESKWEL